MSTPELASELIAEHRMVVALPADSPLARRKRLRWMDLDGQPTIMGTPREERYYEPFSGPFVKIGAAAWVELAEFPGQKFEGKVARTAGAIEPSSRTLLTEVQIPNPNSKLFPGAFARVHLALEGAPAQLSLPTNALLFRSEGPQVGIVDASGNVTIKLVKLGRDFGKALEVLEGVTATDRVILNPSDSLANGAHVEVKSMSTPATPAAAAK